MAFDDAEIARLRASVPAQYRVEPDAKGKLSSGFSQDLLRKSYTIYGSKNSLLGLTELDRSNIGLNYLGAEGTPAFMLTGAQETIRLRQEAQAKSDKERKVHDALIREQLLAQLNARIAELDAEMAKIDERLEEIRKQRLEIGERLEALDELDRLRREGKLDPNNPAHHRLLDRAGITPEDAERGDLHDIIAQRRRDLSGQDDALGKEWNKNIERRDDLQRKRDEIMEAKKDLENADTPEALERAEKRAETLFSASDANDWDDVQAQPSDAQPEEQAPPSMPPAMKM